MTPSLGNAAVWLETNPDLGKGTIPEARGVAIDRAACGEGVA